MQKLILALLFMLAFARLAHSQTSPDGSKIPPLSVITVPSNPIAWTLGKVTTAPNREILRNGVSALGAQGTEIMLCGGVIHVRGRDNKIWKFASAWAQTGLDVFPCAAVPSVAILSWTDTADNEDGVKIERSLDGGPFVEIATVGPNITSYRDMTLLPGSNCYRVRAYNSAGDSGYSNVTNPCKAVTQ